LSEAFGMKENDKVQFIEEHVPDEGSSRREREHHAAAHKYGAAT
jgi:hypothetical protein